MKILLISSLQILFFSNVYGSTMTCDFTGPGFNKHMEVPTTEQFSRFELQLGNYLYSLDLNIDQITAITILDKQQNVSTQTVASTGAGVFARPRQLSIEANGHYAEINCW